MSYKNWVYKGLYNRSIITCPICKKYFVPLLYQERFVETRLLSLERATKAVLKTFKTPVKNREQIDTVVNLPSSGW